MRRSVVVRQESEPTRAEGVSRPSKELHRQTVISLVALRKQDLAAAPWPAPRPILDIAEQIGVYGDELIPYGRFRAKVSLSVLDRLRDQPDGQIVVVTGITPTPAGEGKTTTAISLAQGLGRIGKRAAVCLREPSMGPLFGMKGAGTGGGRAQVIPMEEINLHFNGDLHAVAAAHNLLAAAIDASLYHGNALDIDPGLVTWLRAVDVSDRSLRHTVIGLGGRRNGVPRESGFVITAASEVMAILALASDLADLRARLGRIVVGASRNGGSVTADRLRVAGAMAVLLRDALLPNLVQTLEGQPAFVHTGPFGNIAHANNSLLADRLALKVADFVVTEAGFGSDLGLEKFCHIVCRAGSFKPSVAVLVATIRAIKVHSGNPESDPALGGDREAIRRGAENLAAHIAIVRAFGIPCVVAINRYPTDSEFELGLLKQLAMEFGADAVVTHDGYSQGGAGAEDIAEAVVRACVRTDHFRFLYDPGTSVRQQIDIIAQTLYGAAGVEFLPVCERRLAWLEDQGLASLPVCMAKTSLSLSHDPSLKGRPGGFVLPIRDLQAAAGAGFVVALSGDVQLMPGLGRTPAFTRIDLDEAGRTVGLA